MNRIGFRKYKIWIFLAVVMFAVAVLFLGETVSVKSGLNLTQWTRNHAMVDNGHSVPGNTKRQVRTDSAPRRDHKVAAMIEESNIRNPINWASLRVSDTPTVRNHYNLDDTKIEKILEIIDDFRTQTANYINEKMEIEEIDGMLWFFYDGDDGFYDDLKQQTLERFESVAGVHFKEAAEISYVSSVGNTNALINTRTPFRGHLKVIHRPEMKLHYPESPSPIPVVQIDFVGESARYDSSENIWEFNGLSVRRQVLFDGIEPIYRMPPAILAAARSEFEALLHANQID